MEGLGNALALLGAAFATFLAGTGSAIGISYACRASSGVLVEKPERYNLNFVLVALPSTQGIYGLVIGIMIMSQMGLFGNPVSLSWQEGLTLFAVSLPVAIAGLFSGAQQGKVCASGIMLTAKRPEMAIKAGAIYAGMVELYALFGFVISLLCLLFAINWEAANAAATAAAAAAGQ